MVKFWKFLSISIVAAVCLGLLLVPGLVSHSGNTVYLKIEPAVTYVSPGENFTLNVMVPITAGEDVAAAECHIDFNSAYFSVTNVTPGNGPSFMLKNEWSNSATPGTVDFATGSALGEPPHTSDFILCTIECQAHALEGRAAVDFVYVVPRRRTQVLNPLGVDYLTDWSTQVVNGTVIVGVPPAISVSPNSLAFNAIEGGENPPAQTLEICNSESGTLDWSLGDNAGWLSESPTSGSLGEGDCEDVAVSVDVTGMEAGDYSATITVTGSGEVQVPVSLHIESEMAPIPGGPAGLSASALSISPQQVQPGEEVTISVNVANSGGETGSYNAVLYINEVAEGSQKVSVAAGTSKNVIFTVSKSQAGVYDISLAGQSGQFEVVSGDWVGDGGLGTGGIIAIVVAVIVLIVGLFLIRRGTRRET
jgi:hypothetical protein